MAQDSKINGPAVAKRRGRTENLTPWKPGQSGNPKGRRKTPRAFEDFLAQVPMVDKDGKPVDTSKPLPAGAHPILGVDGKPLDRYQLMISMAWATGMDRKHRDHMRAVELLMAYKDGKPVDRMELTGFEGGPVEHVDVKASTTGEIRKRIAELEAAAAARRTPAGAK
jgi:hypothetical protein